MAERDSKSKVAKPGEHTLLKRIAQKDQAALSQLYAQFSPQAFNAAVKILRDTKKAEDVMHEAFIQIWEKAGKYDERLGEPVAWLLTLVRNKAIERLRSSQCRRRNIDRVAAQAEIKKPETPSLAAIQDEVNAELLACLNLLDKKERKVLELAFVYGMTQQEIATALQEPLGTIKARIRRSLLKLKAELQPE